MDRPQSQPQAARTEPQPQAATTQPEPQAAPTEPQPQAATSRPESQAAAPQPTHRSNRLVLALGIPVIAALIVGVIMEGPDPYPAVGACVSADEEPVAVRCESDEADGRILQVFPGESTDVCDDVPGTSDTYTIEDYWQLGDDREGFKIGKSESSVLCVGPK